MLEDFRLEEVSRNSHMSLEIDVFVPVHRLALEYQGEHHYHDNPSFGSLEMYTARDEEKVRLCAEHDIHLVAVPYWWDGQLGSLRTLIEEVKQDIEFREDQADSVENKTISE